MLSYSDAQVYWCQSMDLIGVTSASESVVEIFRCGHAPLQKLIKIENISSPHSFSFAKHGKLCAIGYQDGRISVVKTDSASEVFNFGSLPVQLKQGQWGQPGAIINLIWKQSSYDCQPNPCDVQFLAEQHLTPVELIDSKMEAAAKETFDLLRQASSDSSTFKKSLIYAMDSQGQILVVYNGFLPVSNISLTSLVGIPISNLSGFKLLSPSNMSQLLSLMTMKNEQKQLIVDIDTRILQRQFITSA